MEIKPGKWKTRNGKQAVVLEVFEGIAYGRLFHTATDEWISYSWDVNKNDRGFGNDLIAPWEEPKPRLRAYINPNGVLYLLSDVEAVALGYDPVPELDALFEKGKE